ncbi:MAG: sensor histidine kinase [Ruminococcus bicirculans (ex Wegman et al. 2014)]|mgnify:CR=1 FL=1
MGKKSIMRMLLTLSISQICFMLLAIITFVIGSFMLVETGVILSPEVISKSVEVVKKEAVNDTLDEKSIPAYIEYAQLSDNGSYENGSINDKKLINEVYQKGKVNQLRFMNTTTYECVGGSSEKWIIGYKDTTSQFSNPFLRDIFPSADLTIILAFLLTIIIGFVLILRLYRNRLSKELTKITNIQNTILSEEDEISKLSSPLKEVNHILIVLSEMEKTVKESTRKQLKQAQLLESSIQALTHDIQTPATVVSGNLELLEETEMNEKQKEYVGYAQDGISRISEYVEELKALVKLEQQKKEYAFFNEQYVVSLISLANQISSLQNITVSVIQKDTADDLQIQPKAIQKAFQNIVSNAIGFSNQSSDIRLQFKRNEYEYIVSVIDNGKGFSAESLNKATQKFYSENKARNGRHYGLGLSIVEKIMEEHSGFLKIENLHEKKEIIGAKVSLVFPLNKKVL